MMLRHHFIVNDNNNYIHVAGWRKILDNDWYFERISRENILKNHIKHTYVFGIFKSPF